MDIVDIVGVLLPSVKKIIKLIGNVTDPDIAKIQDKLIELTIRIAQYAKYKQEGNPDADEMYELAMSQLDLVKTELKIVVGIHNNQQVGDGLVLAFELATNLIILIK